MRSMAALVNKAYLSILGSLGSGASGTPVGHNDCETNGAPIGSPSATVDWTSSSFTSRTGKVLVIGIATFSKGSGNLADGDLVTFNLVRDIGGTPVTVGGQVRVGAVTAGSDVCAYATYAFTDSVTPQTAHTWSIQAASGGHTGIFATAEATIIILDI